MPAQRAPEVEERDQLHSGGPSPARVTSTSPTFDRARYAAAPRPERRFWTRWPHLWFILPAFVAYSVLFLYPTVRSFYLSIFDWSGVGPVGEPVWFANFWELLRNDRFQQAAWNSTKLFAVIFVLQNTVSLGLAVMLNRRSRMTHVYRAVIFLPVVMSAVATGIIWVMMLDPIIGAVNPFLADIGLGSLQREWQAEQGWAMKTVYVVQFWQWNGMAVVLYLAGLQNVPEDLRHAALVDGAKRWQIFRDVTFPMLAPAFTIVTALSFILIFRAFDLIYVLGGASGAPDGATLVLGVLIYGDAFGKSSFNTADARMSYAIAEGVTLFVFLAGVSALLIQTLGRREAAMH
jgi:ABC-type sugar transport system permease subunit